MNDSFNMHAAISQLTTPKLVSYLRSQGWQQKASRYLDRVYFEWETHDGGEPYQLHLPESRQVSKYRVLIQRAIYSLCGVEDREPSEIIRDILSQENDTQFDDSDSKSSLVRVRNVGNSPLVLKTTSRNREHQLLPRESIELLCHSAVMEIEHSDTSLTIHDRPE